MAVDVIIDNHRVRAALNQLLDAGRDLRPALVAIGEILTESTKKRFMTTTALYNVKTYFISFI